MPNSVGRNDNFLGKSRKSSILPTSFDIFIYTATLYAYYIMYFIDP